MTKGTPGRSQLCHALFGVTEPVAEQHPSAQPPDKWRKKKKSDTSESKCQRLGAEKSRLRLPTAVPDSSAGKRDERGRRAAANRHVFPQKRHRRHVSPELPSPVSGFFFPFLKKREGIGTSFLLGSGTGMRRDRLPLCTRRGSSGTTVRDGLVTGPFLEEAQSFISSTLHDTRMPSPQILRDRSQICPRHRRPPHGSQNFSTHLQKGPPTLTLRAVANGGPSPLPRRGAHGIDVEVGNGAASFLGASPSVRGGSSAARARPQVGSQDASDERRGALGRGRRGRVG